MYKRLRIILTTAAVATMAFPAGADDSWQPLGTGHMTDFIINSIFAEAPDQRFEVEVEQNMSEPGVYRINEPYASYVNTLEEQSLHYKPESATPMVIHVEENGAVWFENLSTGFSLGADPINAVCTISEQVEAIGFDTAYEKWPDAFGRITEGNILWETSFMDNNYNYKTIIAEFPTILDDYSGKPTGISANIDDRFRLTLPGTPDDPDFGWETLEGPALLTDDILASFFGLNEHQTMEVTVQRSTTDETKYRLVNPYAAWLSPFSNVSFNPPETRYMRFDMFDNDGQTKVYLHRMFTGIVGEGYGEIFYYSQIRPFVMTESTSLQQIYTWYPDAFGYYDGTTREIRFSKDFDYGGSPHETIIVNPTSTGFFPGNKSEALCIKMPEKKGSGCVPTFDEPDFTTEYFTIDGIRVSNPAKGELLIMKRGNEVKKVIY